MRDIFLDLRYGLRAFKASPAFTIVAVLAVALGIGATTAIFSVVDRVMLRPLPYPEPDRLVSLGNLPHPEYFDWRARNDVFEEMAVVTGGSPPDAHGTRRGDADPLCFRCRQLLQDLSRAAG